MSDPKVTAWPQLQRVAPRLFDEQGVKKSPPVGVVYNAIGYAERERDNLALLQEVRKFVGTFGDRFESRDVANFEQALRSLEQRASAAPLPPDPTSITARPAPVSRARAELVGPRPTALWEAHSQQDPDAPPQSIATIRITQSDNRDTIVWEVQVNQPMGEERWKDFVRRTWASAIRLSWIQRRKLIIQLSGEGEIRLTHQQIVEVSRAFLPDASDLLLLGKETSSPGRAASPLLPSGGGARQLLQDIRHLGPPMGRIYLPFPAQVRLLDMVKGLLNGAYPTPAANPIPKTVRDKITEWNKIADSVARTMVYYLPKEQLTPEATRALGNLLVAEWTQATQLKALPQSMIIKLLLRLPAEVIVTLPDKYLSGLIHAAARSSDPIAALERYEANRQAVLNDLTTSGVRVARSIACAAYCFGAEDQAAAIVRGREVAEAYRAGRWKAGKPYSPDVVVAENSPGNKLFGDPMSAVGQEGYELVQRWVAATEGNRLPAHRGILERFGLAEPATVRGRLVRYGPAEGIPGLIAIFAAPAVTQSVLGINPHRQVAQFHIANLGALHMLNATGGAIADVLPQVGRRVSAVSIGSEVVTSPSLTRTFLRSFVYRTGAVAGLAEGVVWAYPGYFVGTHSSGLITENPTAQATAGGSGAVGLPLGLRIFLGKKGMEKLAQSVLGKMTTPVAAAMLSNDFILGVQESYVRRDLTDEEINLRGKALAAMPWQEQLIANLRVFFAISGYDPAAELFESKPRLEQALEQRERMIQRQIKKDN